MSADIAAAPAAEEFSSEEHRVAGQPHVGSALGSSTDSLSVTTAPAPARPALAAAPATSELVAANKSVPTLGAIPLAGNLTGSRREASAISDSTRSDRRSKEQIVEYAGMMPGDTSPRKLPPLLSRGRDEASQESYDGVTDNAFLRVADQPLSTFSIDVDTASYANVRRFLNSNALPPKAAVRIEEFVNYFSYDYPQPEGDVPFSSTMEVATCPWKPEHRLVRIGLKGREMKRDQRPASNLVFLVDVSGSMQPQNKLPLLKQSMQLLVDQLAPQDQVSIVVYAGASGLVLKPTRDKAEIRQALSRLESGGSTNGASGIQLAYETARQAFIKDGTNRVILATDGDFNVGVTNQNELVELIQREAKSGVFLTVLGFGMDNLKDSTLEKLANKGNGNYAYIDTLNEGRRVLVEQMGGTLVTIAKDVKIQVEFNPAQVGAYRLIGYENRLLAKEDFNDDTKDAGEIGAGHTVTALYEIVPAGRPLPGGGVDELKYQTAQAQPPQEAAPAGAADRVAGAELLTLKLRYKAPDADVSRKLEFPLVDSGAGWEKSSRDFRFGAAVASFGMLLRDSPHKGSSTWNSTLELAAEGKGEDASGYRSEFIGLVEKAQALSR
jgi:Ca-activated chloride channel family protein